MLLETKLLKLGPALSEAASIQALASERELLVALFGDDATDGSPGKVEEGVSPRTRPPDMPSTSALLDQVFESICRPLKVHSLLAWPSSF